MMRIWKITVYGRGNPTVMLSKKTPFGNLVLKVGKESTELSSSEARQVAQALIESGVQI